jgi:hypothetical protein
VTKTRINGGCLCRAVRYHSTAEPIITRTCWCRLCQFIGAGNATVNVCFPSEALTVEGELKTYGSTADSGNEMRRRFCPECGVHVFSEAAARPHLIFARAGTLDDPDIARPAMTIWTFQAPTWACVDASIPSIERQPPPAG